MSDYGAIMNEDGTEKKNSEVNQNRNKPEKEKDKGKDKGITLVPGGTHLIQSHTAEVIELPNDGRVEIVASRRFGRQVTSSRNKDEVTIAFSHGDVIRVAVSENEQHAVPDIIQRCGARIPHGPAVLDVVVCGILFVYAFLLTVLLAHVRGNLKYISIMLIWFFYVIARMNTYNKDYTRSVQLNREFWHFIGISFSIIFMYATLMIVLPMLTRAAFYEVRPTKPEARDKASFILASLKVSVGLALLGMAARRRFHCGKMLAHMDIIKSILLDNVDIFNLIETLGLRNGNNLPLIPKGSILEICILIFCEVAFLVIVFEAIVPYSLFTFDAGIVGATKHKASIQESKEQAIVMVYPYSLLILNVSFLVIRLALLAKLNIFQLAYVIKNVTSIIFGSITLIRTRKSLKQKQVEKSPGFLSQRLQQRRISV